MSLTMSDVRECPSCSRRLYDADFIGGTRGRCKDCSLEHGTVNAYKNHGCRCDSCTAAEARERYKKYAVPEGVDDWDGRGQRPLFWAYDRREPYDEHDPRHGTRWAVSKGCLCPWCRNAATGVRLRRKMGIPQLDLHERDEYLWHARKGRPPRSTAV